METQILEMLSWPATPGRNRLIRAAQVLSPHIRSDPRLDSAGYIAPSADVQALGQYYATQSVDVQRKRPR